MSANPAPFGDATCWLEVRLQGKACLFEFSPRCDTAVVVGSVEGAEIAIHIQGTPPVAFHFERERDTIVVVPGYHSQPRINTIVATGPVAVGHHAAIELPGVALEAWVHWDRPTHLQPSLRSNVMANRSGYHASLPADDQTTSLALEPFTDGGQQHTEVMRPVRFHSEPPDPPGQSASDAERTERFVVPALQTEALFVPTGALFTEVMAPVRFAPQPVVARLAEKTPVLDTRTAPVRLPSPDVVPLPHAATAPVVPTAIVTLGATTRPDAAPTQFLPTPDTGLQLTTAFDLAALPAGTVGWVLPAESPPLSATPSPAAPANQPVLRSEGTLAQRAAAAASKGIAWLGTHTKRSPVAVLTSAAVVTAVGVCALLGVSHLLAAGPGVPHSLGPAHSIPSASVPPPAPSVPPPLAVATPQATHPALPSPSGGVAPRTSQTTPVRKARLPSPAQVAAQHLAGGRYDDAERAYATLATEHPETTAYTMIVALLRARTKAQCGATSSAPACPEVSP